MTSIRRSSRARRQAHTIYDDAAASERNATKSLTSSRKDEDDEDPETDSDEQAMAHEEEDERIEESSSSEEEEEAAPRARKRKTPTKAAKAAPAKEKESRKILVRLDNDKKGRRAGAEKNSVAPTRKAVQTALTALATKVLDDSETAETSLVAALLQCHKPRGKKASRRTTSKKETIYTMPLETIARQVLQEHAADPNKAQVRLFNLLFRSVGGTVGSNLDPDQVELEALSEDEWMELVTSIVKEMQLTPVDRILLCANPLGAAATATADTAATGTAGRSANKAQSVGGREYRKIYEEFWYILGRVALTGNVASASLAAGSKKESTDTDNDASDNDHEQEAPNSRFQVELTRDLVARLIEMVGVGQPDIRAAATTSVYQLGTAMLEQTNELATKLEIASRQLAVAKRAKMSRKADALKLQVDSWKRTIADLEEIVKDTVMGVFMNRYRDSNKHIRADSLKALGTYCLIRPDIFLVGSYLKYFGWLLSDKDACVRENALLGLLQPFREAAKSKSRGVEIDVTAARSVIEKFLKRIADCAIDIDLRVQERAMELLLVLLRNEFLDSLDDDEVWEQINLQALAADTTPAARRSALYFIIEQLEPFDSGPAKTEGKIVECINGVAQWVAHSLSDHADMPIESMRIDLTDLVVSSLRSMPEHKALVTNWTAILKAIDGAGSKQSWRNKEERRKEGAKKRVLLRMLASAVEMEVNADSEFGFAGSVDPDMLSARKSAQLGGQQPSKKQKTGSSQEDLTLALVKALPGLFVSYKEETTVLQSLTTLPRYFLPSVFNLPSRKKDFNAVLSALSEVFLQSSDSAVLQNCGFAITSLAQEEHARSGEAMLQLKKITRSLRDRLLGLLKDKRENGGVMNADNIDDQIPPEDTEHAICLCLTRLVVLSKRCDLSTLLGKEGQEGDGDQEVERLCAAAAQVVANDLQARKVVIPEEEDETSGSPDIPKIWAARSARLHALVAEIVSQSLSFLLITTAWRLKREIVLVEDSDEAPEDRTEPEENVVVRMRDRLVKLIALCFDQYIEFDEGIDSYTAEHIQFATDVQVHAGRCAGDVRSLFPKAWIDAEYPLLRALALTEEGHLIGGFVRFLRSQEGKLRMNEKAEKGSMAAVESLLLPLARGLSANWKLGNRREAGAGLAHITGSGEEASQLVSKMSKVLKKIEPVRLLEAHMACLRQDYEDWADHEPDELDSRPSEEEVAAFEEAEKSHTDKFGALEHQAGRLSASLGVGKLSDKMLVPALLGFVREGVRFAFSTQEQGYDEDLPLGSRLSFLRILSKYLNWIRRDREHLDILRQDLDRKESELREHADFGEVYSDDLAALASFRSAAGLPDYKEAEDTNTMSVVDEYSLQEPNMPGSALSSLRRRMSSVSSIRSKMSSTQASLSPLYEEDAEKEDHEGDEGSPSQQSQGASVGTSMSLSTLDPAQHTIQEESDESSTSE